MRRTNASLVADAMPDSSAPYSFVELNRTFHELSKHARESDEFNLSEAFRVGSGLTWPDLLKNYRTVILSEAGSGKTEEITQMALKLRADGKRAFFLRLEHIPEDFDDAFEVGTKNEFDDWLNSGEEAWLLLDSVDEARLRHPRDFELAVRRLGNRIKTAVQRARIVVTGRTHAWRPRSDLTLCERHFPLKASRTVTATSAPGHDSGTDDGGTDVSVNDARKSEAETLFKIVALDDLTKEQIEKYVIARKVRDSNALLEAIERRDAWSFTTRPEDLQELIDFWREYGRIGTRLEIMRNSVTRRLSERSQDRAEVQPLPSSKVREGVRLLAAATTLGRDPSIQIPDGSYSRTGVPLRLVLSEWEDAEQSTLLSRPIFDEAIYGTVRFHHRPVCEYLTAEWLAALLERPASRRSIESLLFSNQYGMDVVIPTMRPVLPWLALLDDKVREKLRRIAPEVIFEGGDPTSLPRETRRTILAETCEQIASGKAGQSTTSYAAVQRFASEDIVPDIRQLIGEFHNNDEVHGFLIRMIWLGKLRELLPEAMDAALSNNVSKYTRIAAFRAVAEVGGPDSHKSIREHFVNESDVVDREWLSELIKESKPSAEAIGWLLSSLRKAATKERYQIDHLGDVVADFVEGVDIELLPSLLDGLSKLLDEPPLIENGFYHVSQRFEWLLKASTVGAERVIRTRHSYALGESVLSILHKLRAARHWRDEVQDIKTGLSEIVPSWPELNRAMLWYDVQAARRILGSKSRELTNYRQAAIYGAFWSFTPENDFEYACEQISMRTCQDDRLVALSLAFDLYVQKGRSRSWRDALKKRVAGDAVLSTSLNRLLKPPARKDRSRAQESRWRRRAAKRKRREEENYQKSKEYLLSHVDDIRNPKLDDPTSISRAQWYLHERIREKSEGSSRWTNGHWRDLISEYNEEVARAYRDAAVDYWRRYKPVLRSEGAAPNTTPIMVIFGLTGLAIELSEIPNWEATLNSEEVELACRYAVNELNGFPPWFPKLFAAYPEIVTAFLLREIEYELSIETDTQETHYVLSDISWSGEWAWPHLAPHILGMIETAEPKNSRTLSKISKILQGSELPDEDLARLAERKISANPTGKSAPHWYAVWVGVRPEVAVAALTNHLMNLPADEATTFAMQFVVGLWGSRRSESMGARAAFHTPTHLKALYILMHEYIRRDDDIDRAGKGVYSPELRDDAQEARNYLFEALHKIPGKDAFIAMREISSKHPYELARAWFSTLTRKKAEQEADMEPWAPEQVREFHDRLDRTPKNHRELAELAVLRFLDLKDDLEDGDSSVAPVLLKVTQETQMRNYLGHELRQKAFGRYSIPQEEELADAKRPDLRFHGVDFDAPVPTELKLADKWSGPDLFERLQNQLAGDYLRDIRSGRGIFVLVHRGICKDGWEIPGKRGRANFDGLCDALRNHWDNISDNYPGVDDVTVIGIDLTKRKRMS